MRMWLGTAGASGRRGAMIASNVSPLRARRATQCTISGGMAAGPTRRPGVRLAVQADDVGRARRAGSARRSRSPRRPRPEHRVPLARATHRARVVQLRVDHRLERTQQPREPLRARLRARPARGQRLDRRHAVIGGLAPDAVVAGRGRREPDLRQRRQRRVALEQLARLPPGAVDHDQRDRRLELNLRQIDRVRSREQQVGGAGAATGRSVRARQRGAYLSSSSKSTPTCSSDPGRQRCASRAVPIGM